MRKRRICREGTVRKNKMRGEGGEGFRRGGKERKEIKSEHKHWGKGRKGLGGRRERLKEEVRQDEGKEGWTGENIARARRQRISSRST